MSDPESFCREIEAYLCRRNAGHLVRLVGPAFEMVVGWARQGIPLNVALRGIDRFFERDQAKPRVRRRPIRIEFCEADVLDAFDEWRRAVGVGTAGAAGAAAAGEGPAVDTAEGAAVSPRAGPSLREHLDRVATRLTAALASSTLPASLEPDIERLLERLAADREASRTLRGAARQEFIAGLQRLDDELMDRARATVAAGAVESIRAAAEADLAAFRGRMAGEDYRRAVEAATSELLRERLKLPVVSYT